MPRNIRPQMVNLKVEWSAAKQGRPAMTFTSTCRQTGLTPCSPTRQSDVPGQHTTLAGTTRQTRGIHPVLFRSWASVRDDGPTLEQHWMYDPCLLR